MMGNQLWKENVLVFRRDRPGVRLPVSVAS